MSRTKLSRLA